jgi:phosphoribosyl 1,2-cyclic phosphodiesterase
VRLIVCGVRGSTPAPGADFVRYGGHTSCVAITADGDEAPSLVLDAGTGLQRLSRVLGGEPFRGTILLGHLHWDHTHGLPFFAAGDREGSSVRVLLPAQGEDPEAVLRAVMSPPHFPITPADLRGAWTFGELSPGTHLLEQFEVLALEIPHKGGRTFGFRVTDAKGASVAYLSDHSPTSIAAGPFGHGAYHEAARALVNGVDLLIHDAQYTAAEFPARSHFGHSSVDYAVGLAEACGAGRLLLFHHDPPRTDAALDAMVAGLAGSAVPVAAAAEGCVIEIPARPPTAPKDSTLPDY